MKYSHSDLIAAGKKLAPVYGAFNVSGEALTFLTGAMPEAREIDGAVLESYKRNALNDVNGNAEIARLAFLTPGSGQAMVYQRKAEETHAILAASDPLDPANYPLLAADIGIDVPETGDAVADLTAAANIVKRKEDAWLAAAADIERMRRRAKRDLEAATDKATIDTIVGSLVWPKPEEMPIETQTAPQTADGSADNTESDELREAMAILTIMKEMRARGISDPKELLTA